MKIYTLTLFFCTSILSLNCMEYVLKYDIEMTIDGLQSFLTDQQTQLNKYKEHVPKLALEIFERQINDIQEELNQNNPPLYRIRDSIDLIGMNLNNFIKSSVLTKKVKKTESLVKRMSTSLGDNQTSGAPQDRSTQRARSTRNQTLHNQTSDTLIASTSNHLTTNQSAPRISASKPSKYERTASRKNPKITSWIKVLTYLPAAGIFTGIGVYSYYKLSPEQWYRPIFIGVSILGGTTFSLLAYKNWK